VESYDYVNEDGRLLYQVQRMTPKSFRQRAPDPAQAGRWIWKLDGVRRVPYRLPAVLDAIALGERVIVCEGERDVHTLEGKGMTATTNAGGAGKWRHEYGEFFPAGTEVAIIVDRDEPDKKTKRRPGYEHGLMVYKNLYERGCIVKIFECPEHKDISEHLAAGLPLKKLRAVTPEFLENYLTHTLAATATTSTQLSVTDEPAPRTPLRVMYAEEVMSIPTPPTSHELLGPLVYRGHRLIVGAETGGGKTSLMTQIAAAIIFGKKFLDFEGIGGKDTKVLLVDVEQGTKSVQRAYRESGLADAGSQCGLIHEPNGLHLDTDEGARRDIESVFASREFQVAILDPAYNLFTGDQTDEGRVRELMAYIDDLRRRYEVAVLIPMHVRKPPQGAKFTMNELFGSKAYTWGAEAILGLRRLGDGAADLHFWKDREGSLSELGAGVGKRWPLTFDKENGFRKDTRTGAKETTRTRVQALMEEREEMSLDNLWFELGGIEGPKHDTIERALLDLGAMHGEGRKRERVWQLPATLPGMV
jgi:hypothetical protein